MPKAPSIPDIWIVRNGEREDVVDPLWFSQKRPTYDDPNLAKKGKKQVAEAAKRLLEEQFDHIFTSPFEVCVETAQIISSARKEPLPIKVEPGFSKTLHLKFPPGNLSTEELKKKYPLVDETYKPLVIPQKREEHFRQGNIAGRVGETIGKIREQYKGTILVVGHKCSAGALVQVLTGTWGNIGLATLTHLVTDLETKHKKYKSLFVGSNKHLTDTENLRAM